ncbi:MAG TPA: GGDEF and EAL domain-containing protein [Xanthobacteraceae bacterium]|nr:GGDEF and EAL domain-containing protein [Xanthobacteraceae bacterium]
MVDARPAQQPESLGPGVTADILVRVGEAAYAWDLATDALVWSANAPSVLGVDSFTSIASGRAFAALLDPASPANPYDAVVGSAARDNGTGSAYELCYCLKPMGAAPSCWIEDTGRWFAGLDGRPARAVGVVRVVTGRHQREERLAELSATDPLTGEMNRARLTALLGEALEQAGRYRSTLGFLLIAIDDLGHVNRSYGFDVADQAIAGVAKRLRARLRGTDALAHFSDGKFGLLLHDCCAEDLATAAQRFISAAREAPLDTAAGAIMISVTAGGVVAPRHARTPGEAMGRALEALDLARTAGRGAFRAFQPSLESEARRRENLRLTDVIVAALNDRRIDLAFQPVVRADTRALEFHEALVRLREPDGHVIDATAIVAVAEKLDLVRLIDHRVLELVAAELKANPGIVLSINVSASTVHDPVWMTALASEMQGGAGARLIVEITESAAVRDVEATRGFVGRVKALGCRAAIDDFGAGYTSFRNLRRLGVDIVKIDGSFVANLERAPDDRLFVRALLDLVRALGLKTVAEWVQTESAASTLAGWGCDYLQGSLVGDAVTRAQPPGAIEARAG